MFSIKINLLKGPNRLLTKTQLETMDYVYMAQPFVFIVTKNLETKNLDIVKEAQPFIGTKG